VWFFVVWFFVVWFFDVWFFVVWLIFGIWFLGGVCTSPPQ
jgi:hypothetical protein